MGRFKGLLILLSSMFCALAQTNPPVPNPAEQEQFIEAARQAAQGYANSLPNFLCTQTIRRYNMTRSGLGPLRDTLTVEVSFQEHGDHYALTQVNGVPAGGDLASFKGAISTGEFGNNMLNVFASRSKFRFDKWTIVRSRPAAIYAYRVDASEAHYQLLYWDERSKTLQTAMVGLHGEIVIDRDTHALLRIRYVGDSIPASFRVQFSDTVEYDYVQVGDSRYWLPVKAVMWTTDGEQENRNDVEFHSYRKFEAESRMTFGDSPPEQ